MEFTQEGTSSRESASAQPPSQETPTDSSARISLDSPPAAETGRPNSAPPPVMAPSPGGELSVETMKPIVEESAFVTEQRSMDMDLESPRGVTFAPVDIPRLLLPKPDVVAASFPALDSTMMVASPPSLLESQATAEGVPTNTPPPTPR